MKQTLLITLLLCTTIKGYTQDYMDKIAIASCQCLENVSDTLTPDAYNMKLGLCMLEASVPYKKQLKKDHNIDFSKIDTQGEELGELIGMRMATHCPEGLLKIAALYNDNTVTEIQEEPIGELAQGMVIKVENEFFVTFTLKGDDGKTTKYYWLTYPESNQELPASYKDLMGINVTITYTAQNFFDPKIQDYRPFNIISKIITN